MAKNIVYFDLETQKSAEEVGGWTNVSKMGMSVGVTYSTARGGYCIYGERQVNELITELQRADLIVAVGTGLGAMIRQPLAKGLARCSVAVVNAMLDLQALDHRQERRRRKE